MTERSDWVQYETGDGKIEEVRYVFQHTSGVSWFDIKPHNGMVETREYVDDAKFEAMMKAYKACNS